MGKRFFFFFKQRLKGYLSQNEASYNEYKHLVKRQT